MVKPPRSLYLRFPYGSPVGQPGNKEQQLDVLKEALDMLETANEGGIIKDSTVKYSSK